LQQENAGMGYVVALVRCTGGVLGVCHDLVSSADEIEVVLLRELCDDLRSPQVY